ncbi:early nodulin-like protein 15 [Cicer arietinum]|uniref:Cucumber peeling cupredoxin-like n=1 Tax=Cicer arietinum TaxID=3827 RepID=A0A1S2YNW4_CICAR|nr:cucumber peeling cupredoxin-like [Cicer arietinum]
MMSKLNNMSILLVIGFAAAILQSTEATDHIVGGSTGWISSPPASFYSNWASNITFRENDVLVFNFVAGAHTVAELNKANYDSCNLSQPIQVIGTSPAKITLNKTGEFYFSCSFQGHCSSGQKLSVKVISSSPAPANPPSPTNGPSPPPSGTTPSPPPSGTTPSPPPSGTTPSPPPSGTTPSPPPSGTTPSPPSPTPPTNGGSPPPSSPTQPDATPPSEGSATTLFATFSILIALVINLLF